MITRRIRHLACSVIFACSLTPQAFAEITMPSFFSDRMVIQRETGAHIWGKAAAGQSVQVVFAGQTQTTTADKNGRWRVALKGLKASKKGAPMTIRAGKDSQTIRDVLVGEVWLASGQSNMEWPVARTTSAADAAKDQDDLLRVYVSENTTSLQPATDFAGNWKSTRPGNTARFTAVGYEFAKALRKKLDVPVGIIECSWGGKPVQAFVSHEALQACPGAGELLAQKQRRADNYDPEKAKARHNKSMANYRAALEKWKKHKEGKRPGKPALQRHPSLNPSTPSAIYNGMIAPLAGYSARGAIWYQGESNARGASSKHYGELLECLIQDWRRQWGTPLSFYYVQLANFRAGKHFPNWVLVQDEMRRLLDDSNTKTGHIGMAVINDIGQPSNIHPPNKKDVGQRLARWALHQDYGMKDIVVSGPLYQSHKVEGDTVKITFEHAAGLKSRDGKPLGAFEIAGSDNQWHPAKAGISGNHVTVRSPSVKHPTQVRYAWHSFPKDANLVNKKGLPASCFTTK